MPIVRFVGININSFGFNFPTNEVSRNLVTVLLLIQVHMTSTYAPRMIAWRSAWCLGTYGLTALDLVVPLLLGLKGEWNHREAIPARYWPLLQELRAEIAAEPGLERRARRVNHELDNVALGRWDFQDVGCLYGSCLL